MFQAELNARRKAATTGVLLCHFLGGIGAHRFSMRRKGLGILNARFFWTTMPACIALVECFLMPRSLSGIRSLQRRINNLQTRDGS